MEYYERKEKQVELLKKMYVPHIPLLYLWGYIL
jgi:hypothetical protein